MEHIRAECGGTYPDKSSVQLRESEDRSLQGIIKNVWVDWRPRISCGEGWG